MSRTFKESVREEIYRREGLRQDRKLKLHRREREEEKKMFKENPEKFIMDCFQEKLKWCYEYSSNFEKFDIEIPEMFFKLVKTGKKIGFKVENDEGYCKFTVPAFEKGNRRTPAQMVLYKYERALAKKRKERKKQLLAECKKVKKAIADGKFRDEESIENFRDIYAQSKEGVYGEYEEKIVYNFFDKIGLKFEGSKVWAGEDEWRFSI